MAAGSITSLREFFSRARADREQEELRASENKYLASALEVEKLEGHRMAVVARTVALGIIGVLLPFLNPNWNVLYYEALLILFVAVGWAQLRFARVGMSRIELVLIYCDLALMTIICTVPNPFLSEEIPTAFTYRFDTFIYFFLFLALGTLAYSWRTVIAMGMWVMILWMIGVTGVSFLGTEFPNLTGKVAEAVGYHEIMADVLDPNSPLVSNRVQEIVVFMLVAVILAIKGRRSNALLMKQADVAMERANLSRYFPSNMVDVLASSDHDAGAVRSQDVAVLFVDIVGFTQIAETHPPESVMALLRRYHATIEKAIFENNGTLDKYLGDGVMATFGTPEPGPHDALNAMNAARQILRDMEDLRVHAKERDEPELKVSTGIHYGSVILGDIGPTRRLEFAVVGDTVNVASRLEAETRSLGCDCVVSDAVISRIQNSEDFKPDWLEGFEPRQDVHLKGRQSAIDVWIK
ncbi:MAG: adenylate/guanylate cyclase domain-containing protein [Pseudomonadota bacterium]